MPRCYFHVRRGPITVLDHDGIELASTADAEVEAAEHAQPIVTAQLLNGEPLNAKSVSPRGRIIVADDSWQTLFAFPFQEAKGGLEGE
jgi:hypothetical protein